MKKNIDLARSLRKNSTPQERKLWNILRNSNIYHYKFKRQHPIGDYVVDFICKEKMLIIEIDGGQHNQLDNIKSDNLRTKYLESRGFKVLRFWNIDIDKNIEGVYKVILNHLGIKDRFLTPTLSPRRGKNNACIIKPDKNRQEINPHPNPLPKEREVNIDNIVQALIDAKQPRSEFVELMEQFNDPYLVLIGCILSLRTNDKTTYPATLRMLELARTPEQMSGVSVKDLAQAIYPVGFYENKAKQIIELSRQIVEELDGKVPDEIEDLIKFNGVGRKTANLVLAKGFNKPAICVDVHVHRIFNRLGYIKTKNPEETEFALRKKLPQKHWLDINTLMVTHGQNICKPQRPKCAECPIAEWCEKII